MNVSYARVSSLDQTLALQQDALRAAGCERVFTDTISGATDSRPGLDEAVAYLCANDVLVVW
jgi:DNA invertase Pin-like site-specific DNA recombinase